MKNTIDRKQIAFDVAAKAAEAMASIKGFFSVRDREYLEQCLSVHAQYRLPKWLSASQLEWRLSNIAAAEVKTHFVLDSDQITEGQLFGMIWGGHKAITEREFVKAFTPNKYGKYA